MQQQLKQQPTLVYSFQQLLHEQLGLALRVSHHMARQFLHLFLAISQLPIPCQGVSTALTSFSCVVLQLDASHSHLAGRDDDDQVRTAPRSTAARTAGSCCSMVSTARAC